MSRRHVWALRRALISLACLYGLACGEETPPKDSSTRPDSTQSPIVIGPSTPGMPVATCSPCVLRVGQGVGDFTLSFSELALPGGRRGVAELRLLRPDRPGWTQTFPVRDSAAMPATEAFFVGATDVNFDGHSDLFVATSRGVANTYADYWLFTLGDEGFGYLGNYPLFAIDSAQRRLETYERGGDGGMIYESKKYQFIDGALTVVEVETQEGTDQPGVYRRSVQRLENGELRPVSSELVRPPAG
jgi:hypothetical protein